MIDVKELAGVAMNVRGQLADSIPDPQVTLGALAFANELGSLLWRIQAGQDITRSTVTRTTFLIANIIRLDERFKRGKFSGLDREQRRERNAGHPHLKSSRDIVERFAYRVLVEWTAVHCVVCDGRGKLGLRNKSKPRPLLCDVCDGTGKQVASEKRIPCETARDGVLVRREYEPCSACNGLRRTYLPSESERTQACSHCSGTGFEPVNHAARALALGIPIQLYEKRWLARFDPMLDHLDRVDERAARAVRRQRR
jgi:hypothetical protein